VIPLLLGVFAFAAWGQSDPDPLDYSFDPELYRPHSDVYGYGATHGASTLRHLQIGVGLWGNYSEDTLLLLAPNNQRLFLGEEPPAREGGDGVLDVRTVSDLQVGVGIGGIFSFTVDLPIILWQSGYELRAAWDASVDRDIRSAGPGDIRLTPKFVILDLDDQPIGVALYGDFTLPTGADVSYMGEGSVTAMPVAVVELSDQPVRTREHLIRVALNVGYKIRTAARYQDLIIGNEVVYRGALGLSPSKNVEVGVEGFGSLSGPDLANRPLEVSPFVKLTPGKLWTIHGAAGFGIVPGVGSPDIRVVLGATLQPSFNPRDLDRDKDGIPNKYDKCENIPEDPDGFEDEDGCPDLDNDGDGILDVDDRCPNHPEDIDGYQDADGCPDPDNDRDGILDIADRCPDQAEVFNAYQDDDGCPDDVPVTDRDGDGYRDEVDRCPDDPEDFDGFEDTDGCPDVDNDGDGILDVVDQCPDRPEDFNEFEDEDGCPDKAPPRRVRIERTHIVITEKIFFEFDRATIKPVSYPLLNEIGTVILDHPELALIQVEGHTDSIGDDGYNLELSQRRAESVVEYLLGASVESSRLSPVGFGESTPVAENESDEGRATNRRVEFRILRRE